MRRANAMWGLAGFGIGAALFVPCALIAWSGDKADVVPLMMLFPWYALVNSLVLAYNKVMPLALFDALGGLAPLLAPLQWAVYAMAMFRCRQNRRMAPGMVAVLSVHGLALFLAWMAWRRFL